MLPARPILMSQTRTWSEALLNAIDDSGMLQKLFTGPDTTPALRSGLSKTEIAAQFSAQIGYTGFFGRR